MFLDRTGVAYADMLDAVKVLDWLDDAQRSLAWAILDGVAPDGTAE